MVRNLHLALAKWWLMVRVNLIWWRWPAVRQSLTLLYLITTQKKTVRRLILSLVEILAARPVLVVST